MYDVPHNRSIEKFSTIRNIPNDGRGCSSPIRICRDTGPCTRNACFVTYVNGHALTELTCEHKSGRKNELLARFEPKHMSSTHYTVRCVPGFGPTRIRTQYAGFWRNIEYARQSLRSSPFLLFRTLSSELVLAAGAFCFLKAVQMIPCPLCLVCSLRRLQYARRFLHG